MITPAIIRMTDVIGTTRARIVSETDVRILAFAGLPDAQAIRNARLLDRGWCPFLIHYCQNNMNDFALDWLDGSEMASFSDDHQACDSVECARNDVDATTYKMLHCTSTCQCKKIRPELQDVLRAINEDRIPKMTLHDDQGALSIEVCEGGLSLRGQYVAYSHVWVDGWGSTTEQGIYECQARRLAALTEQASGVCMSWWIDSHHMPYDIIFFDGPKISSAPYRWAPATLMARSTSVVDPSHDEQRGECTEDGLCGLQCFLLLDCAQDGVDYTTYHALEVLETTFYGIYWDPESSNGSAAFNAVIVCLIEDDRYLKPELEQVVEAVAVMRHPDMAGTDGYTSDYVGVVTITKLERHSLPEGTALTLAEWHVERLCIT